MHTLEFDTRTHDLWSVHTSEQSPVRSSSVSGSELALQPVDRSQFFTNNTELVTAVKGLEIMLVERNQAADSRATIKAPSSLIKPGDSLSNRDMYKILQADRTGGARLRTMVNDIRLQRARQAQSEDWWSRFSDPQYFTYNVFQTDPTEQILIGRDQIEPVTIYNFGERLNKTHLESIIGGVATMSALTDGYTRAVSPYIVIHEAFAPHHFRQSGTTELAAGRAWQGEPFIEARRSALNIAAKGSVGQPWVSQLIAHELSHQIDEEVSEAYPDFNSYFHYIDKNGDGLIDYVKPSVSFASTYSEHEISASRPVSQYGYTNGSEDLATVGEEVPFGGHVDPLRERAYLEVIEAFKEKGKQKYGDMQPLPKDLRIEIARGGEIQLPVAPALLHPIRVRVENTSSGLMSDFFKKIFR